jgi:hypothetical protein
MKRIYSNALKVILWLGKEADNSNLAMDSVANKGSAALRPKGGGFRKMWTRDEGRALLALCERGCWGRIWIIQEILHARRITVLCGKRNFEWHCFEGVYGKLEVLELRQRIKHQARQRLAFCTIDNNRCHNRKVSIVSIVQSIV